MRGATPASTKVVVTPALDAGVHENVRRASIVRLFIAATPDGLPGQRGNDTAFGQAAVRLKFNRQTARDLAHLITIHAGVIHWPLPIQRGASASLFSLPSKEGAERRDGA